MNDFYEQSIKKLDEGVKASMDKYGNAMKQAVRDALADFCKQDGEFAQAVVQGGSFADCMKAVAGGVKGNAISDLEAYRRAVQYFFKGADIKMTMTINLCASVEEAEAPEAPEAPSASVKLDLLSLL